MVHVGLYSVGTYHKKFGRENKKNKKVICRVSRIDSRQSMLCRVSAGRHSAKDCKKFFTECHPAGARQRTLCRVPAIWHSAKNILIFLKNLCRVPAIWHSAKPLNNKPVVFLSSSLPHTLYLISPPPTAPAAGPRAPPATRAASPRAAPTCAAPAPSAAGHAASPSAPPPRRRAARRRPCASSPSLRPGHHPRSGHLRHPPAPAISANHRRSG
jgi:hypothetical protein